MSSKDTPADDPVLAGDSIAQSKSESCPTGRRSADRELINGDSVELAALGKPSLGEAESCPSKADGDEQPLVATCSNATTSTAAGGETVNAATAAAAVTAVTAVEADYDSDSFVTEVVDDDMEDMSSVVSEDFTAELIVSFGLALVCLFSRTG